MDDVLLSDPTGGAQTQDFLEDFCSAYDDSDNGISNELINDQAGLWENHDVYNSNSVPPTAPFSYHEMKDLFDKILTKCRNSKDKTKFALGSIGMSMKEIASSDRINSSIFENESSSVSENNLETKMKQLIDSHKN